MNNNQFRRLVFDTPNRQNVEPTNDNVPGAAQAFGGRKTGFMPMTPRTVKGGTDVDFARQLRERNAALQNTKAFKSSAPKGVKYSKGYTDRAKARVDGEREGDGKAERIKALEEQMKLGQISPETFEALRSEITGGDVENTHLVKGLDRRLLERVRRGEDVLGTGSGATVDDPGLDVDDELDKLEGKEIESIKKERISKTGSMAPPPIAGVKRSRDEIMAELRAQRAAAAKAKADSALDNRWRKVGKSEKNRIEIDHKGREVLITVDEDGVVKKKVRKVQSATNDGPSSTAAMPDASLPVLGADTAVPEMQAQNALSAEEEEDDDIFEGIGATYDPLGNDYDDDSGSDSSENDEQTPRQRISRESESDAQKDTSPDRRQLLRPEEELKDKSQLVRRNYFKESSPSLEQQEIDRFAGVQQLLKKAANLDSLGIDESEKREGETDDAQRARLQKRATMLAQHDRDLDDMDMGFGESRYEDGDDEVDGKVQLSEWKDMRGGGDDEHNVQGIEKGEKKKRKPKKRKGNANNAADIMRVIEGRKTK